MKNKNGFLELLYGWMGAPFVVGCWAMSFISYFWAIYIAFKETGIVSAFITFCLPVVGEIYWTIRLWNKYSFYNHFVLLNCCLVICVILGLTFINLSAKHAKQ